MKHLIGDGITDDTDALEAWARGEIVLLPDGTEVRRQSGEPIKIPDSYVFLIGRTLDLSLAQLDGKRL